MNVLIGVSGSIAAYKTPEIIRRLRAEGHDVRVVMTKSSKFFVSDIVFQAISGHAVRSDLWDKGAERAMSHIELARWCDCILIAPATAHVMATLAMGMANDLLSTVCITTEAPIFIAPSMNQAMWKHLSTQQNIELLRQKEVNFIGPNNGLQACGETGWGRMVEPTDIASQLTTIMQQKSNKMLESLKVVVTAGPTREPLDPVRYITNRSSGKMGFAIAQAVSHCGAQTTLIAGPVALESPDYIERVDVETAEEMLREVIKHAKEADIVIACAAICDYCPKEIAEHKIKSSEEDLYIAFQKTKDILKAIKLLNKNLFTVGFAAETQNLKDHALKKLKEKNANMIIGNRVGNGRVFDQDNNSLSVYSEELQIDLSFNTKHVLAKELAILIKKQYDNWVKKK